MHKSLKIRDRVASMPIFDVFFNGTKKIAQLTNDGYLRLGLSDFLSQAEQSVVVFEINEKTYAFHDGYLQFNSKSSVKVNKLHLMHDKFEFHGDKMNYKVKFCKFLRCNVYL